jgi:hypothetical protein
MNFCRTEMRANANIRGNTKLDPSHDKTVPYVVPAHIIYATKCVPGSCGAQNIQIKLIRIYFHMLHYGTENQSCTVEKSAISVLFSIICVGQFGHSHDAFV